MSLSGSALRFDRSGRRLIAIESDEITVVDAAGTLAIRLPYRAARAAVGFDDELWIATHDDRLVRVDPTGAMLGAPAALPFAAHPVLAPAPCGPPAAVWSASAPVMCSLSRVAAGGARSRCLTRRATRESLGDASAFEAGAVLCAEVDGVDAVIPITGQRVVVARGSRVILPSGLTVALAPRSQVLGGCVTVDGKTLTVLAAQGGERQLIVISLGLGQILHCRAINPRAEVAVARNVAAIQIEPRVLRVIDLATNRDLGGATFGHDVAAFAIAPTGRALATRSATGEIELHPIDPLFPQPFSARHRLGTEPTAPEPSVAQTDHAAASDEASAATASNARDAADSRDVSSAPGASRDHADALEYADAATASNTGSGTVASRYTSGRPAWLDRIPSVIALTAVTAGTPLTAPIAASEPVDPAPREPVAVSRPLASLAPFVLVDSTPADDALVQRYSAPTAHATDWLCGSGDYLQGST